MQPSKNLPNPLNDTAIRNVKATTEPKKYSDGGGLFLLVTPSGSKLWRLAYRFEGKQKQLSLGAYPYIGLKDARDRREEARKLLAHGVDPSENKKAVKEAKAERSANSFEVVAREWIKIKEPTWAASHTNKVLRRLEMYVFPWLGAKPIADIKATDILQAARRAEGSGAIETAHRIVQTCGQAFYYAIATGRADRNPALDLKGALQTSIPKHMAAVTKPKDVGPLLRALDGFTGSLIVRCALQLAPLVFVRPGELRAAKWEDIDLDAALWSFTASKTGAPHIVPLSRQAVAILREIQPLTGDGRSQYVFPSARTRERPMSDNAILAAMRRMGIAKEEMSGHGFRAMARTILDEGLKFRPDYIEHQLAHVVRDPHNRAYNRTAHLEERHKMMQAWADYLDKLKAGADIIPFRSEAG